MQLNGTNPSGPVVDGGSFETSTASFPFAGEAGGLTQNDQTTGAPRAYLNWLVFDRDYVLIPQKSGFKRITTAAHDTDGNGGHERIFSPQITIDQPGYVYIYLSNEEETQLEVFFDDFKVEQVKSPVVQMDDYYPFGLTFNSYRRENSVENKIRFQGQEHIDDLNLGWVSFKWRNHMPDIGRFFNIDPLAAEYVHNSTYAFSENKVVAHIELEDLESVFVFDQKSNPNNKGSYTADVYVVHDDGKINGPYKGSSFPNNASKHNTVKTGVHAFNNLSGHDGGKTKGLNLVSQPGSKIRTSPGKDPNGNDKTMTVVNFHEGYSSTNRGSEGCQTIEPSDAAAFFDNFNWTNGGTTGTSEGTVTIYRGDSKDSKRDKALN